MDDLYIFPKFVPFVILAKIKDNEFWNFPKLELSYNINAFLGFGILDKKP